jgi:hypothetical protein
MSAPVHGRKPRILPRQQCTTSPFYFTLNKDKIFKKIQPIFFEEATNM